MMAVQLSIKTRLKSDDENTPYFKHLSQRTRKSKCNSLKQDVGKKQILDENRSDNRRNRDNILTSRTSTHPTMTDQNQAADKKQTKALRHLTN